MKKFLIITLGFTILSCGTSKKNTSNSSKTQPTLLSSYWVLEKMYDKTVDQSNQKNKIGFQLDQSKKSIQGFAGCNRFFGTYTLNKQIISFSQMGATKMACLKNIIDESRYFKLFEKVTTYAIQNGKLSLYDEKGSVLAIFHPKQQPEITEKYWKLKYFQGHPVKMGKQQEREVYFILRKSTNTLEGFGGCNSFSGSFKILNNHEITFSKVAATLKACPNLTFDEASFLKIFNESKHYSIQNDELILKDKTGKKLAEFEAVYFN